MSLRVVPRLLVAMMLVLPSVALSQAFCGVVPIRPVGTPPDSTAVCTCTQQGCFYQWVQQPKPRTGTAVDNPVVDTILRTHQLALEARRLELQYPTPDKPYLGVTTADLGEKDSRKFNIRGAKVKSVAQNTAASAVWIKKGDVITQFGPESVTGAEHLHRLIQATGIGEKVELRIWRDGKQRDVPVVMGGRKPE